MVQEKSMTSNRDRKEPKVSSNPSIMTEPALSQPPKPHTQPNLHAPSPPDKHQIRHYQSPKIRQDRSSDGPVRQDEDDLYLGPLGLHEQGHADEDDAEAQHDADADGVADDAVRQQRRRHQQRRAQQGQHRRVARPQEPGLVEPLHFQPVGRAMLFAEGSLGNWGGGPPFCVSHGMRGGKGGDRAVVAVFFSLTQRREPIAVVGKFRMNLSSVPRRELRTRRSSGSVFRSISWPPGYFLDSHKATASMLAFCGTSWARTSPALMKRLSNGDGP